MKSRGRQSIAKLQSLATGQICERPRAPITLTVAQTDLWFEIVNRMPADWFTSENLPLLEAYVRACDIHRKISAKINKIDIDDGNLDEFSALTQMQNKQAAIMKTLATSMRLTQQSRYRADKASTLTERNKRGGLKPWQSGG